MASTKMHLDKQPDKNQNTKNLLQCYKYSSDNAIIIFIWTSHMLQYALIFSNRALNNYISDCIIREYWSNILQTLSTKEF